MLVGVVHCADDLEKADDLGPRVGLRVLRQRTAFHELHREVLLAVVLTDLVDRHDVRMIKVCR